MGKFWLTQVLGQALALTVASSAQQQHPQHGWDYGEAFGPSHWGDLSPEFAKCTNGHHESPIDLRTSRKVDLPPIHFAYKPSPLHIVANGHTIMVNYASGIVISIGGKNYELKHFHFHIPSEERIKGRAFDMSVHL